MVNHVFFKQYKKRITKWISVHYINLAIFNTSLVILTLLYMAKYFDPYWLITINMVVMLSFVFSIFLLGAKSTSFFLISLFFWILSGIIRMLGVTVWAERICVYVFESLFLSVLLLFFEYVINYNRFIKYGKN